MSSLLNRKYQKLTLLEEPEAGQGWEAFKSQTPPVPLETSIVSSAGSMLESTKSSLPSISAATRRRHFLMYPNYSIDKVEDGHYSLPSSFDQTMDATPFPDMSQEINESRSESWFTASSQMDDSLFLPQLNLPAAADEMCLQPARDFQGHSVERTGSSTSTDNTRASVCWNPDQKVGVRRYSRSPLEESKKTGVYTLIDAPMENVHLPCHERSTSPAEYLRLKWKKIFSHPRPCRLDRRSQFPSNSAGTTPTSIKVSNQNMTAQLQFLKNSQSTSKPSILVKDKLRKSSHNTLDGDQNEESACKVDIQMKNRAMIGLQHSFNRTEPDSLHEGKPELGLSPVSLSILRLTCNMEATKHLVIGKDQNPISQLNTDKNQQNDDKHSCASDRPSGSKGNTDRTPGESIIYPVSANLKTSFDEDEERIPVFEPSAHVGALALAWAKSTRRSRRPFNSVSSDHIKTGDNSQEGETCDGIPMRIRYKSGTDRKRPLSYKDFQDPMQFNQGISDFGDNCQNKSMDIHKTSTVSQTGSYRITSSHSEHIPIGIEGKNTENVKVVGGFLNRFKRCCCRCTGGQRVSSPPFGAQCDSTSEAAETSQDGDDGQYNKTHVRRGGQNIPPICVTGGLLGKRQPQGSPMHNIGWRLSQRKILNEQRRRLADYSLVFAVLGVFLMVVDQECRIGQLFTASSNYSLFLKSVNTAMTVILVSLVLCYHAVDIKLFSVNNCIDDWRLATSPHKIWSTTMEVLLCLIHPAPVISNALFFDNLFGSGVPDPVLLQQQQQQEASGQRLNSTDLSGVKTEIGATAAQTSWITADSDSSAFELCLSIPMFFRFYLIFRLLLLHSTFYTDAGSRSIGALNRVKINVRFVLKTLATTKPGTMLLIFIISMWVITSWIMRICERTKNREYEKMVNTMWLISVTFLSIGYGDMVPHTNCGRSISVFAGVMGSACTALVVAVVAKKLELTRAEKHVHNFMRDNKVYKQLRHSAANVLRETWLFYKHTRLVKRVNASRVRRHQRSFLQSIRALRKAKAEQRKLRDDANSMLEIGRMQSSLNEVFDELRNDQSILVHRLTVLEVGLTQIQTQLSQLPETLSLMLSPQSHDEAGNPILPDETTDKPELKS